jgi:hypothetical protein
MKPRLFAAIFAAAVCATVAASAQDGEEPAQAGDASTLETCLNDVRHPTDEHGRTCIGLVSQPCMEGGGYSTMEMVRCLQRERHAWRALAERYTANLRGRETETQIARLDAYLAESENWLEADCAYQASLYEGGSLAGVTGEACRADHHAETAIELHGRLWDYDQR